MRKLPFNKMHGESSRVVLHEEFLELCAISTSDKLTEAERQSLETHLSECPGCREAMRQLNAIVDEAIPAVASEYLQEDEAALDDSWSQDGALANLLGRLAREEHSAEAEQKRQHSSSGEMLSFASSDTWLHVWTLSAAGVLLFVALGILAYRLGLLRGASMANITTRTEESIPGVVAQRLSDAEREYEVTRTQLKERDDLIADLGGEIQRQSDEMSHLKLEQRRLEGDLRVAEVGRQSLLQERSELVQKSEVAQAQLQGLQRRLAAVEKQAAEDTVRATASQTQI
jgi:Putative zinc-finger